MPKTVTNNSDYTPGNVNEMGINQLAPILNSLVQQATGQQTITPTNESEFVSVAQTALLNGYDPMTNAISQMISRTIFSIRPYTRKFKDLEVDSIVYGNHVRKLQTVDKEFVNDDRLTLKEGESIDMYEVRKPEVIQTNWYGSDQFEDFVTIYKDQLDTAFSSSQEFARFLSMIMQNILDRIEQAKETNARMVLQNLIGATIDSAGAQVVNVLAEYNAFAGTELTIDTVFNPQNFPNFVRWLYSFVQILSDYMTERSANYHKTIADKVIMRHTPKADQRLYLYNPIVRNMESIVTSTTYHDDKTVFPSYEGVNYWQSINDPMLVNVTPATINESGVAATGSEVKESVIGILFDREACGITNVNEWTANTPFNARGGYYNEYWHFTRRFWNDLSENAIVLIIK